MVTNVIHWLRSALYFFASFEFLLLASLYQIAYRGIKKSKIIRATQRISFVLGLFFAYMGLLPIIKSTGCGSCYDKAVIAISIIMVFVDIYAYKWVMLSTDPKQKGNKKTISIHSKR